ncbi:MAG: DUF2508 family protein [Ruminococcaceae bacterium]|nr:DUF2508 family protein [Oscillospiraceae bacterium]MBQ2781289.1 DUF2508 family protein [Clostridia bacterium]
MTIKRLLLKEPPLPALLEDIREVCRQMEQVKIRFDMQSDADLVDACIYEQAALQARYRYLLEQVRRQGMTAPKMYADPTPLSAMPAAAPLQAGEAAI